jgi:hypothetical protein
MPSSTTTAVHARCLCGSRWGRWRTTLQGRRRQTGQWPGIHRLGSQAASGRIPRWPAWVEPRWHPTPTGIGSSPIGDDPKNGRARCPSQPSPGTCAPPRSPSSSRCPKDGQPLGPGGHAGLGPHPGWPPTLPRPGDPGPAGKPCPSHPQPARAWCRRRVIRCVVADSALDRWASPADRCPGGARGFDGGGRRSHPS